MTDFSRDDALHIPFGYRFIKITAIYEKINIQYALIWMDAIIIG